MKELDIVGLYDGVDEQVANDFSNKMDSSMRVKTDYYKDENNTEWMDIFEKTLPYIEKIFKNRLKVG